MRYCLRLNVRNEKVVVLASRNPPSGQKFKMLYLGRRRRYFKNSVSITYMRYSKMHD